MREQPPPPGRLFKPHRSLSNVVLSGLCTGLSGLCTGLSGLPGLCTVAEVVFLTTHLALSPKFPQSHFSTIFYNQETLTIDNDLFFVNETIYSSHSSSYFWKCSNAKEQLQNKQSYIESKDWTSLRIVWFKEEKYSHCQETLPKNIASKHDKKRRENVHTARDHHRRTLPANIIIKQKHYQQTLFVNIAVAAASWSIIWSDLALLRIVWFKEEKMFTSPRNITREHIASKQVAASGSIIWSDLTLLRGVSGHHCHIGGRT